MKIRISFAFAAAALVVLSTGQLNAAPMSSNGITFSEVGGGVTITGLTGMGTSTDPFVLSETVTSGDVTLSIEGLLTSALSGVPPFGGGFHLQKVVTNDTGSTWNFYDHELQEILGTASEDGDGLSFAQGLATVRPFTSDAFGMVDEVTDVRDFVNFFDGSVADGATVTFNYAITDNTPVDLFYLRQRPNFRPGQEEIPEPASLMVWAVLGLVGLGGFRAMRRRRAKVA